MFISKPIGKPKVKKGNLEIRGNDKDFLNKLKKFFPKSIWDDERLLN